MTELAWKAPGWGCELAAQPEHPVQGELRAFPVRRLQRQLDRRETPLAEDRPEFGKGQEPLVAVVVPHAACADAAERQIVLPYLDDRFIHADADGEHLGDVPLRCRRRRSSSAVDRLVPRVAWRWLPEELRGRGGDVDGTGAPQSLPPLLTSS